MTYYIALILFIDYDLIWIFGTIFIYYIPSTTNIIIKPINITLFVFF